MKTIALVSLATAALMSVSQLVAQEARREEPRAVEPQVAVAPRIEPSLPGEATTKAETNSAIAGTVNKESEQPARPTAEGETAPLQSPKNEIARNRPSYFEVTQRAQYGRHDRQWWAQRYDTIILAGDGYYYLDAGYWYPAHGFDPGNDSYSYYGPIYGYDNLAPDQVIANVQTRLQQDGYFDNTVTGVLDPHTRAALGNFQRDHNLSLTSAIDEATVEALGLI